MRLRPDFITGATLMLLAGAPALPAPGAEQVATSAEVDRALAEVKADPNLAAEKKATRLRWDGDMKPRDRSRSGGWFGWLGGLFAWLAASSAVLFWVILAGLAALLVVFIIRVLVPRGMPARGKRFVAPTHVQDLDIRPESLPADIGAAARALWDAGDQRAALALLYRGMLSRLVHTHEVPIRDSSTEGDCLNLAAGKLDAGQMTYVTQLVRTWQRAIYGGLSIETPVVWELCAGFSTHLGAAETLQHARFAEGAA